MKQPFLERQVHDYLQNFCLGRSKAKVARELAVVFSIDIRSVAEVIRGLRKTGNLIGSAKDRPMGYYIPVTDAEIKAYMNDFKSEAFDMLRTYSIQRRAAKVALEDNTQKDFFKQNEFGQFELAIG